MPRAQERKSGQAQEGPEGAADDFGRGPSTPKVAWHPSGRNALSSTRRAAIRFIEDGGSLRTGLEAFPRPFTRGAPRSSATMPSPI